LKVLVVYDSLYGNTEKIARAIAGAVAPPDTVRMIRVGEAGAADLEDVGLLFLGSPTQGGQATKVTQAFLDNIPAGALEGVKTAAFDTRLKTKWVKLFGYAAGRIEAALKGKGATLLPPGLFIVKGNKGPLLEGEEERAVEWARGLMSGGR
jgi:flavodoxin